MYIPQRSAPFGIVNRMESYIKAYYPKSSLVIYKLLEMYGQSDLVNTTQTNPYGHVPNGIRLSNYTTETLCIRQ